MENCLMAMANPRGQVRAGAPAALAVRAIPPHRLTNHHEEWDGRGHIATHDVVDVRLYLLTLLRNRSSARDRGRQLSEARRRHMSNKQIEECWWRCSTITCRLTWRCGRGKSSIALR